MGSAPKIIQAVKLFTGIIISQDISLEIVKSELTTLFGNIDYLSKDIDFNKYTTYYDKEMGSGLIRYFVAFENLVDRKELPNVKLATIDLEKKLAVNGNRRVNLDPGYMTLGQIFLASTKDNFFRIYIDKGIFAEVTIYFERGQYSSFPWTYRDFDNQEYKDIFLEIRSIYKVQLNS